MSTEDIDAFPHHPKNVSPQWLTNRLKTSNLLSSGQIESIEVKPLGGVYLAQSAILNLTYSNRATGSKPESLFIKIARPDTQFGDVTAGEVEFFRAKRIPPDLPIVKCLDICIDGMSGKSCLLLEDLSQTHMQHDWPLPPKIEECHSIVKALAQIHANWWNSDCLESVEKGSSYQIRQNNIYEQLQTILPKFLDYLGDRLTTKRKQIMRDVFDCLPILMHERILHTASTTLIHGDAHFWNVMLPKNPQTHHSLLIDWEEWARGISGYDLAYMITLYWTRDRREQLEVPLLQSYYHELRKDTDINYSFDDLINDYKLGCLRNFIIPAFHLEMGIEAYIWWPHLERLFLAFEDWECEKLI